MSESLYKEKKEEVKLTEVKAGEAPPVEIKVAEDATEPVESPQVNQGGAADKVEAAPPKTPATPEPSETPPSLGPRYDILGLVGTGGMGTVWKVHDRELNEDFAIKVLKPELVTDETALKRFQKEANLASELTHANIAAIFGPGEDGAGRPYIIMRYVDGESLADILKREGKLSEERAIDIFNQLCEALSHSHMKGIIHRDIKPSNIIISKTESGADLVHLVDFGIARCVYDEVTKTQALTKAVDVFGSPRYMSPEQLLGEEVTAQSDIYSLGIVLYEMLTGAPPFADENPVKLIMQQLDHQPDMSVISQSWQHVVEPCLSKRPINRPKSVNRIIAHLHSCSSKAGQIPIFSLSLLSPALFTGSTIAIAIYCMNLLKQTSNYDQLLVIYGLVLLLIATFIALFNSIQRVPQRSLRHIEYFSIINGLLIIILTKLRGLVLISTAFMHFGDFRNSFLIELICVVGTLIACAVQNSQSVFEKYCEFVAKLDNLNADFGDGSAFSSAWRLLVRAGQGGLHMGAICFGILVSIHAFILVLCISSPQAGEKVLAPIFYPALQFKEMLLLLVLPFLVSIRRLPQFEGLPSAKSLCRTALIAILGSVVSTVLLFKPLSDDGFIDYLKVVSRSGNFYLLSKISNLAYPNTHWGALAILASKHPQLWSPPSSRKELIEVLATNPDPLLQAAAIYNLNEPAYYQGRVLTNDDRTAFSKIVDLAGEGRGHLKHGILYLLEKPVSKLFPYGEGETSTKQLLREIARIARICSDIELLSKVINKMHELNLSDLNFEGYPPLDRKGLERELKNLGTNSDGNPRISRPDHEVGQTR